MSTHLVTCTSCGTANRIPDDKEGVPGNCGSCHRKLPALYFTPQPVTDASFEEFVARYDGPILAEFWAAW